MTGGPETGPAVSLRPAAEEDVARLVAWHADPEVARYWDGETFTAAQVRERLRRDEVDPWIVEEGGEPVGYLQAWWDDGSPRRGGLDGFLVPEARGRGIMPVAARVLAGRLLEQGWAEVTVDPYRGNERAVRAWARAGFEEVGDRPPDEEHIAPWVLMRFAPGTIRP